MKHLTFVMTTYVFTPWPAIRMDTPTDDKVESHVHFIYRRVYNSTFSYYSRTHADVYYHYLPHRRC